MISQAGGRIPNMTRIPNALQSSSQTLSFNLLWIFLQSCSAGGKPKSITVNLNSFWWRLTSNLSAKQLQWIFSLFCRSNSSLLHKSHLAMVQSQVLFHRVGVGGQVPLLFQHLPWLQLCCVQDKDLSSAPCRPGPCWEWRQLCSISQDGLRNPLHPLPACSCC